MAYQNYYPYQQINPYAPPMQTGYQQAPQSSFSCKPVTSREEALAMQTDFLAAGTIMPDLSHGVIYLKRFNPNTGASDFIEFACQQQKENAMQFVQSDEYEQFKREIYGRLEAVGA